MAAIVPYGPTAARDRQRPGHEVRPASTTVDIHSHVWSVAAAEVVAQASATGRAAIDSQSVGATQAIMARQVADRRPLQIEWQRRLPDLDAMAIDLQILTPVPAQMYQGLDERIAMTATRLVNDNIAAIVGECPGRFAGVGTVPLEHIDAAAEELDRLVTRLGLRGVQIPTNIGGRDPSAEEFAAFWATAERLGTVVFLHPTGFTQPDRLKRFYLNNTIGNPLETTIALHTLILDGVLERHPALKLVAAHGGAFAAAYSGRMDHAWGARADANAELPHPPSSYLRRVYFDSLVFTPHQLSYLVSTFGADHVLMGTDYPADMGDYDPVSLVMQSGLDAADAAAVAGGNALRLLGLAPRAA